MKKCHIAIPPDTDTLSECFVPLCGISRHTSHWLTISWSTPLHFMPKHQRVTPPDWGMKFLKFYTAFYLLKAAQCISIALQCTDALASIGEIPPFHRILRAQGCLMYLRRWRTSADAAQQNALNGKSVARAEYRTYIIKTAHIVKHYGQAHLGLTPVMLYIYTIKIPNTFFFSILSSSDLTQS